jgi:cation transport protein ChaC
MPGVGELWVFGYGSLMWRPGFPFAEAHHAHLTGYRRCFCIYSFHHRGTPGRPGLVLGLDRGGACTGVAFRVEKAHAAETLRYLRAREQVSGVYREARLPVALAGSGREAVALTYIVERAHPNYAGQLPLALQARLIKTAVGRSGANLDYFISTLRHVAELGIRERELERLLALIGPHTMRLQAAPDRPSPVACAMLRAVRSPAVSLPALRTEERRRFLYRTRLSER